jgi:hypothetical protein
MVKSKDGNVELGTPFVFKNYPIPVPVPGHATACTRGFSAGTGGTCSTIKPIDLLTKRAW